MTVPPHPALQDDLLLAVAERRFVQMVRPTLDSVQVAPLPDGPDVRPGHPDHALFSADAEALRDHWPVAATVPAGGGPPVRAG